MKRRVFFLVALMGTNQSNGDLPKSGFTHSVRACVRACVGRAAGVVCVRAICRARTTRAHRPLFFCAPARRVWVPTIQRPPLDFPFS